MDNVNPPRDVGIEQEDVFDVAQLLGEYRIALEDALKELFTPEDFFGNYESFADRYAGLKGGLEEIRDRVAEEDQDIFATPEIKRLEREFHSFGKVNTYLEDSASTRIH